MRILIVAKTRRGAGACVGGITEDGHSVRLIARDAASNERAGLEYEVGEVWEIDCAPDPDIVPPHVENIIVAAPCAGRECTANTPSVRSIAVTSSYWRTTRFHQATTVR